MTKPLVTASVDKPKAGEGGELRNISIEPANNGFMCTVSRKPKRGNKNECYDYDSAQEKNVFEDAASLAAFITKTLGKK